MQRRKKKKVLAQRHRLALGQRLGEVQAQWYLQGQQTLALESAAPAAMVSAAPALVSAEPPQGQEKIEEKVQGSWALPH